MDASGSETTDIFSLSVETPSPVRTKSLLSGRSVNPSAALIPMFSENMEHICARCPDTSKAPSAFSIPPLRIPIHPFSMMLLFFDCTLFSASILSIRASTAATYSSKRSLFHWMSKASSHILSA